MVSLDNRRKNVVEIVNLREKLNNSAMLKKHPCQDSEEQLMKTIQSKYEGTIRSEPVTATTADTSIY